MKLIAALLLATLAAQAHANFDEWKQRADAARDSGQLERDQQARDRRANLAAIPGYNRSRLSGIAAFVKQNGGWKQKPQVTYDADGELATIDFARRKYECRVQGPKGRCVNTETLEQMECYFGFQPGYYSCYAANY